MSYQTLIGPAEAAAHLEDPRWVFVDCRFDIRAPRWGAGEYEKSHVRGAVYADLDRDLSGPIVPGVTGRHPLPSPEALREALAGLGIDGRSQVVAYDASTGAMTAARLWWLLKWAGHDGAAVLEGGFTAWTARGLPCQGGVEVRSRSKFTARMRPDLAADASRVAEILDDPAYVLLDARAAERYRGINETIDPVAGHIRGAFSAPYGDSLREDGTFRPKPELAALFAERTGGRDPGHVVFYCGSGVTAAHAVLAMAHSGKGMPRLYPGSWSDWITDPTRPIAK
jgi:thiosulfate/3-mercaptopyruvate sulfurtransferase